MSADFPLWWMVLLTLVAWHAGRCCAIDAPSCSVADASQKSIPVRFWAALGKQASSSRVPSLLNMGRFNANLQLREDKPTCSVLKSVICYHQTLRTELLCSTRLFVTIGKKCPNSYCCNFINSWRKLLLHMVPCSPCLPSTNTGSLAGPSSLAVSWDWFVKWWILIWWDFSIFKATYSKV